MKSETLYNLIVFFLAIVFLVCDVSGDGSPIWAIVDLAIIATTAVDLLHDEDLNF